MLTTDDAWKEGLERGNVRPVYRVTLYPDGDAASLKYVTGDRILYYMPPSVHDVSSVASELDVITRTVTIGGVEITFANDGEMTTLASTKRLLGKRVDVALAALDDAINLLSPEPTPNPVVAESVFETIGTYVIREVLPNADGTVTLSCDDLWALLGSRPISAHFVAMHPLEIIKWILDTADVPPAMYDATSLAPATWPTISHITVSRTLTALPIEIDRRVVSTPAATLVNELAFLLGGTFAPGADGVFAFVPYDGTAASDRDFTANDIVSCEQIATSDLAANRIEIGIGESRRSIPQQVSLGGNPPAAQTTYELNASVAHWVEDTVAQTNAAFFDQMSNVIGRQLSSDWLNGAAVIDRATPGQSIGIAGQSRNLFILGDTSIDLVYAALNGFAGARFDRAAGTGAWTVNTDAQLSGTRLAYFLIEGPAMIAAGGVPTLGHREILSCNLVAASAVGWQRAGEPNPVMSPNITTQDNRVPFISTYTIAARGLFGTTAPAVWFVGNYPGQSIVAPSARVWDITAAVRLADLHLTRFANGLPIVRLHVPLRNADLQLGDFISFIDDRVLFYGHNGVTNNVIWEVTRVEIDALSDSPGVMLDCAHVRDALAYTPTKGYGTRIGNQTLSALLTRLVDDAGAEIIDHNQKELTVMAHKDLLGPDQVHQPLGVYPYPATIPDNATNAYLIEETSGADYLKIDTTNGSEAVSFGNATTNPTISFLGTGTTTFSGPVKAKLSVIAVSSSPYTVTTEQVSLQVDTSAARVINLRAAATAGSGAWLHVQDATGTADVNMIRIMPNGSETINGRPSLVFSRAHGELWLYCDGSNWLAANARPDYRREWYSQPKVTDFVGVGCATNTQGTASDGGDATRKYITCTTAAAPAAKGGLDLDATTQRRWNPRFRVTVKTGSSIADVRVWIGLSSSSPPYGDDNSANHGALLRYSTVAGDTTWQAVTSDGAAQTVTDTTLTVATSTAYQIEIAIDDGAGTVEFVVNGKRLSATANLPGASTNLLTWALIFAAAASAKDLSISKMAVIDGAD